MPAPLLLRTRARLLRRNGPPAHGRLMKMRTAFVTVLAATLTAGVVHAEELKIGYVDVQRALNEVEDGREAKAKLKKEFDEKQRVLDERQEELRVMKEDLDKQGALLTAEAKQDKLNDLQRRMLELQQMYFNMQRDLQSREGEMTKGIFERMNRVLNTIAEEENYSIILERNESSILYARGYMDLTNELIRKYNALLKKEGFKPGSTAPPSMGGGSGGGGEKKPAKKKDPAAAPAPGK